MLVWVTSFPGEESRRIPVEFIPALCLESAEPWRARPQPPAAPFGPREVVPWGHLPARTGVGHRALSRWRTRASRPGLARFPERPRLLRLCRPPQAWRRGGGAAPTVRGVLAPAGAAPAAERPDRRVTPPLAGRGPTRAAAQAVGGAGATAQGAAPPWPWLRRQGDGRLRVLRATAFQAAAGEAATRQRGQRGAGEARWRGATGLARWPGGGPGKPGRPRVWTSGHARLACPRAAFHGLVQGQGGQPTASGCVPRSMAELRL